ncbi:hypothetical protein ACSBR2_007966 [Camellia fascicularis]
MVLNLRSNKFEGGIPYELCRLSSLQILDLAHNNLSRSVIWNKTNGLRSLNSSRNRFTGRIPENVGDMEQLETNFLFKASRILALLATNFVDLHVQTATQTRQYLKLQMEAMNRGRDFQKSGSLRSQHLDLLLVFGLL